MTVRELIEKLSKLPGDTLVLNYNDEENVYSLRDHRDEFECEEFRGLKDFFNCYVLPGGSDENSLADEVIKGVVI